MAVKEPAESAKVLASRDCFFVVVVFQLLHIC